MLHLSLAASARPSIVTCTALLCGLCLHTVATEAPAALREEFREALGASVVLVLGDDVVRVALLLQVSGVVDLLRFDVDDISGFHFDSFHSISRMSVTTLARSEEH